jgi:hypothetical protein
MHAQTSELISTLMSTIEYLKEELFISDKKISDLEDKLVLYEETGSANISRKTFRNYMIAAVSRKETDEEWRRFMIEFVYDNRPLNSKIYTWIDSNIPQ